MGGGQYRDDLTAAHGRIAELEEKVAALESELARGREAVPAALARLETEVEARRTAVNEKWNAGRFFRAGGTLFSVAYVVSAVAGLLASPRVGAALGAAVFLLGCVVLWIANRGKRRLARQAIRTAEAKLARARATEGAQYRVRVVPPADVGGEPEAEPVSESRRQATR